MRNTGYVLAGASLLWLVLVAGDHRAEAGGTQMERVDVLPVTLIAEVESLLGEDTVVLKGWLEVVSSVRTETGTQVMDLRVQQLELIGASRFGAVSVRERADDGESYQSRGEVRGTPGGDLLPGTARLDLFLDLDVPSSPVGGLHLHNETSLRLAPSANQLLTSWPPFGVLFETADPNSCLPLLDDSSMDTDLDICIGHLALEIAPETPSYSVSRGASRFHPADILALIPEMAQVGAGQAPFVRISCRDLGLSEDGCDNVFTQDNVNALSYGSLTEQGVGDALDFSVAPGTLGAEGSAVAAQNLCPPAEPGLSPEPESDIYRTLLEGMNILRFDGNGPVGACENAFPLGLLEAISARDDLNAFASHDPNVDQDGGLYFSLDADSPSLERFGYAAGDVLRATNGGTPQVFASAETLGLEQGDDLDGLCLEETGDSAYDSSDRLLFSLAPGSPTLLEIGAGPGDILRPGLPPSVAHRAGDLGLVAGDDVNALSCGASLLATGGSGDANCDGATNSIDATLLLQHIAGLLDAIPCEDEADVNGGGIDSTDAALILQLEAGLLLELPV